MSPLFGDWGTSLGRQCRTQPAPRGAKPCDVNNDTQRRGEISLQYKSASATNPLTLPVLLDCFSSMSPPIDSSATVGPFAPCPCPLSRPVPVMARSHRGSSEARARDQHVNGF